jgi:hemoglobin
MTASGADITTRADIAALVTEFYRRAFDDPLLGPIFVDVARLDIQAHLPIMCDFWQAVLLRAGTYHRNALTVHTALHRRTPLTATHFTRWTTLWNSTVDDLFAGPVAARAKTQAGRIATSLHTRLTTPHPVPMITPSRPVIMGAMSSNDLLEQHPAHDHRNL